MEYPHVGTQAEVLGAAITPDGEGVDASEVILLQEERKIVKMGRGRKDKCTFMR